MISEFLKLRIRVSAENNSLQQFSFNAEIDEIRALVELAEAFDSNAKSVAEDKRFTPAGRKLEHIRLIKRTLNGLNAWSAKYPEVIASRIASTTADLRRKLELEPTASTSTDAEKLTREIRHSEIRRMLTEVVAADPLEAKRIYGQGTDEVRAALREAPLYPKKRQDGLTDLVALIPEEIVNEVFVAEAAERFPEETQTLEELSYLRNTYVDLEGIVRDSLQKTTDRRIEEIELDPTDGLGS
jgi:hypothetical protein